MGSYVLHGIADVAILLYIGMAAGNARCERHSSREGRLDAFPVTRRTIAHDVHHTDNSGENEGSASASDRHVSIIFDRVWRRLHWRIIFASFMDDLNWHCRGFVVRFGDDVFHSADRDAYRGCRVIGHGTIVGL